MPCTRLLIMVVAALSVSLGWESAAHGQSSDAGFTGWLQGLRNDALAEGIPPDILDDALRDLEPLPKVIELDRRQPEFMLTFSGYLSRAVTEKRIQEGRRLLKRHEELLRSVEKTYGVQPRFLLAFWGLESNYGEFTGGFPVIGALATLAYDPRRSSFFRKELLNALHIVNQKHIALPDMMGSWAGAMGQLQFMPSTFRGYAVDYNKDGRRDIWRNLPDVFASAANYLSSEGWRGDETWGREVTLPQGFDWNLTGLSVRKHIDEWRRLGVRRADGGALPKADIEGSILIPAGHQGPAFLVYGNFRTTMVWNRSIFYAIAVGYLADRIAGKGPLRTASFDEQPLRREEIEEIQTLLAHLGYAVGKPDGIFGSRSRNALRAYQRSLSVPADGHPTVRLLAELRRTSGTSTTQEE